MAVASRLNPFIAFTSNFTHAAATTRNSDKPSSDQIGSSLKHENPHEKKIHENVLFESLKENQRAKNLE